VAAALVVTAPTAGTAHVASSVATSAAATAGKEERGMMALASRSGQKGRGRGVVVDLARKRSASGNALFDAWARQGSLI
jgi:hypothetical protein